MSAGHEVFGSSRTQPGLRQIHARGAIAVQLDVFDPQAADAALADAEPDAVIHRLTPLAGGSPFDNGA